ncbi:MAG: hypothetical protein Q9162_007446 [Coniocarpon cinnabarinum]
MDVDSPVATTFAENFNAIASLPAQKRVEKCPALLEEIFSKGKPDSIESDLTAYLVFILDINRPITNVTKPTEPLSLITSRPLLSAFADRLKSHTSNDVKLTVAETAIRLIQPRVVSFEDQDAALKHILADAQANDEEYVASARTLDSINLQASSRSASDEERVNIWVRIARCYLEVDDPTQASSYLNRAKQILHNVRDPTLRLLFYSCSARVLDSQRQFLDAANAYHTISYEAMVDEDDRLESLQAAMTCAILAPAGPQRSRMLAKLYKDERAAELSEYGILEKIFLDRMLGADEVERFSSKLQDHQKARTADGSTVVEKAMLEHNLLGASRIYRNIKVDQLGALLGVDPEKAEQYAASMIQQGRLVGYIDQIDQVIFFQGVGDGSQGGGAAATSGQELRRWDTNVQGLAEEVEKVTTMIQNEFPEFYAANMAF